MNCREKEHHRKGSLSHFYVVDLLAKANPYARCEDGYSDEIARDAKHIADPKRCGGPDEVTNFCRRWNQ